MDQTALIEAAAQYMQARPVPFAMLPTRTKIGTGQTYPAPHVLAPLIAAHCPLAMALLVQNMAARRYTAVQCPSPAPFAVAHTYRQHYAANMLAFWGYIPGPRAADFTWPANAAAMLECWLAVGDNMARALQYMGEEMTGPMENAPAIISQLLYNIDEHIEDDYENGSVTDTPESPAV